MAVSRLLNGLADVRRVVMKRDSSLSADRLIEVNGFKLSVVSASNHFLLASKLRKWG
jgi:hypothetical protein